MPCEGGRPFDREDHLSQSRTVGPVGPVGLKVQLFETTP